jgi:hypothetical protein
MSEGSQITIKKGTFNLTVPREELVEVSETADGVAFNFKGGLQLYYYNNFLPSATKQIIKNTADSFPGKKLIFDLDNESKPVLVDAT